MDYDQIGQIAGKLTVVGLLLSIIVLILRGWLVTGREYTALMVQVAELRQAHKANVDQIEALKAQNRTQEQAMISQQKQIDGLTRELMQATRERDELRQTLGGSGSVRT